MTSVIFLPGSSGDRSYWHGVAELLRVQDAAIFGWPGLLDEPPDSGIVRFTDLTDHVLRQIEFRHIETPVDLVAHSMGCVVALMLTLRRPEVVKRLVLGGASGGIDISPFETQEWRAAYERELPADAPRWFMDEEPNLETELPRIEQPVLLVWGGDDRIVPPAVGKRFTELLPYARLAIIPGGAHAVARERPGEVARHIRAFLGEGLDV